MALDFDDKELNACIEQVRTDCNRYYWTVYITLGFKDFLDNNIDTCRFVYAEKTLRIIDNFESNINPDFILQYNDNKNGI